MPSRVAPCDPANEQGMVFHPNSPVPQGGSVSDTIELGVALADPPMGPLGRPGSASRPALIAAVVASLLLVTVAGLVRGQPSGSAERPDSAGPGVVLRAAAAAADSSPEPVLELDQARYTAMHEVTVEAVAVGGGRTQIIQADVVTEEWVPGDPRADWVQRVRDVVPPAQWDDATERFVAGLPTEPAHWRGRCGAYYPVPDGDPCRRPGLWQDTTSVFVAGLPRDPQALWWRLRADAAANGSDPDREALECAAQALNRGLLPLHVRANLYRALTYLPGLTVTRRVVGVGSRQGTALGLAGDREQVEIVVDPGSGDYLGYSRRLTTDQDGLPAGTAVDSIAVTSTVVPAVTRHG